MFRRRTRPYGVFLAGALAAAVGLTAGAAAQQDKTKSPPPAGTQPSPSTSSTGGSGSDPGQTVFRPKETIAPGKPVSFPPDI